ncbi:MAG: Hsp20/alpha crystallin family protein [Ectothiorhodospiraceae bacterium]|jgi:HSP20 family protein|nr:Hsp20/alpha crystallin family protein [Ectothiorhodospiraceae bacterium]
MSTLDQLRHGLGNALENLAQGWHQLRERAAQALTRFTPGKSGSVQTLEEGVAERGARWGLLAAEVREHGDRLSVDLEVPGMDLGDFDIQVLDGHLVIRGEKRVEREHAEGRYFVMERAYGCFERAIPLPAEVDADKAQAHYRKGVLTVTLPKTQPARTRRIEVQRG